MKRSIALAILAAMLVAPSLGCTKNKQRASRLEAELQRCRETVKELESGNLSVEEQSQYAAMNCGTCEEGGAQ